MVHEQDERLRKAIAKWHLAANEFVNGRTELLKEIYSRRDDATVFGGWGGHERGWKELEKRFEWAASRYEGGKYSVENISLYASGDLAYSVDMERHRAKLKGVEGVAPIALRVTTVYRREDDAWKIVHRHADPLITVQPTKSVVAEANE